MYNCDSKNMTQKVTAIKAVRGLAYVGLKDAKDLVEKGKFSITPDASLNENDIAMMIHSLRGAGVEVIKAPKGSSIPLSMLEDALGEAVFEKNYGLAEEILSVLKRNAV